MDSYIDRLLVSLTSNYLRKTKTVTIVVAGSIGKTSTTQAVAKVLATKYRVIATRRNYNTLRGLVASVFQTDTRSSILGWVGFAIFVTVKSIFTKPNNDFFVLELGTDAPGQLIDFAFLKPRLAIITAVQPEHMAYFHSMEAVAKEELIPVGYASEALINADLVARRFLKKVEKSVLHLYGRGQKYSFDGKNYILNGKVVQKDASKLIGASGEAATTAALAAGELMGLSEKELRLAATSLDAEHGRMSLLKGKGGSLLIDDTYNSSPEALRSAIQYLYQQPQKRKIALLGMMNEMGSMSEQAHREAGRLCDPKRLELIVTLGRDANSHLADEAEKMGCSVIRTNSPTEAADIAMHYLSPNTVVLLKGSQNGVYLEEATKRLLANQSDSAKLVRQHSYWPAKKAKQFSDLKS